jgi:hypothetical protein
MSDTDFEIEDSVEFSSARNHGMTGKIISTMEKLQVGQSFLVPGDSKLGSSAIQAYYRSAEGYVNPKTKETVKATHPDRAGRVYRCRGEDDTRFRVWRLPDGERAKRASPVNRKPRTKKVQPQAAEVQLEAAE